MKDRGGVLINIGSEVSDIAIPLQGIYSASKHAVLGYTDALRMELEHDKIPISVTLVKPSAINTPYVEHARNYMDEAPTLPPPIYGPEVVADAILRCAVKRVREVTVGGGGRATAVLGMVAPRTMDLYMERAMFSGKMSRTMSCQVRCAGWAISSVEGGRLMPTPAWLIEIAAHPMSSASVVTTSK